MMTRFLIVFLLLFSINESIAQNSALPGKYQIRKELKKLIREVNKTQTENDSEWSKHIQRIPYNKIQMEYNEKDLGYDPDATIVFRIIEINNSSKLYGNDTIWVVFNPKSFCRLDVIDWFHPLSNQLPLLIEKRFPSCN